jgi:hypothetical protein
MALRIRELLEAGADDAQEAAARVTVPPMHWYEYLYPNNYKELLLSPEGKSVVLGLMLVLAFVVASIAGGSVLFRRRDI